MTGIKRLAVCFLAALVLGLAAGCGSGGGAGSSLSAGGGRAALDDYLEVLSEMLPHSSQHSKSAANARATLRTLSAET